MGWWSSFTADVLNKCEVQANGRTNSEMTTGHQYKVTTDKGRRSKTNPERVSGYHLGRGSRMTYSLSGTEHGDCEGWLTTRSA